MDNSQLIDTIMQKVIDKLNIKPKILILADNHHENCHKVLECPFLQKHFETVCALTNEYDVNIDDYEAIAAFDLSIEYMSKICAGILDTPYLKLMGAAILKGKKIYVPCEEIELLACQPGTAYYDELHKKLDVISAYGVKICRLDEISQKIIDDCDFSSHDNLPSLISDMISGEGCVGGDAPAAPVKETDDNEDTNKIVINKRVLTEKDLVAASLKGATQVWIQEKTLLSDLAREYAMARGIEIVRRN